MEERQEFLFYFVDDGGQYGWTRNPKGVRGTIFGGTNNLTEVERRFPQAKKFHDELADWVATKLGGADEIAPDWRGELSRRADEDTIGGTCCRQILNSVQAADSLLSEYGEGSKFGRGCAIDALQGSLIRLENAGLDSQTQRAYRNYVAARIKELGRGNSSANVVDATFRNL